MHMEFVYKILQNLISDSVGEAIVSSGILEFLLRQTWLILLFCILYIRAEVALKNQDGLREKLYIHGKTYYDIILDIFMFSRNKPRNDVTINKLEWDFNCTYHPENRDFLDIEEKWTINFSPDRFHTANNFKLGIQCGNFSDLQQESITASQNNVLLGQDGIIDIHNRDCESLNFPLNSEVSFGKSSEVKISFVWKKFIIVDRKDDYFYFLPRTLANEVKLFSLKVEHPYDCVPSVYLLKRNWFGGYKRIRITKEDATTYKCSFEEQPSMNFEFMIQDLEPRDVVLIIFDKPAAPQ